MASARLDVWVAGGDPCTFDLRPGWRVRVVGAGGTPDADLPTECGRARFDLPPGAYAVAASRPGGAGCVREVRVAPGEHACVTLFPPPARFAGTWLRLATDTLIRLGDVEPEVGRGAVAVIGEALRDLPASYAVMLSSRSGNAAASAAVRLVTPSRA